MTRRAPFGAVAVLAALVLPAQEPAVDSVGRLAALLDKAHGSKAGAEPVDTFNAELNIEVTAGHHEQAGTAELRAQFLLHRGKQAEAPLSLLRYQLIDSVRPTVRGRDRDGYWAVVDGKSQDLDGRNFEEDRKEVKRNITFAQQLLRFFAPGDVLRGLQEPGAIEQQDLQIGRLPKVPCYTVRGRLADFPLRDAAKGPVDVQFFVRRDDGRLAAIQLWPRGTDEQGKPLPGEMLRLDDCRAVGKVLVPHRIDQYRLPADKPPELLYKLRLVNLVAGQPMLLEAFDRPR